jgi:hypothetical protein
MITYIYYALMCVICGRKELGLSLNMADILSDGFPIGLLIPFFSCIGLIYLRNGWLVFLPFCLFLLMNVDTMKRIYRTIVTILLNPKVIDI